MADKDGGPAFPADANLKDQWQGMTLRDYFAAKALTGMFAAMGNQRNVEAIVGNAAANNRSAKEQVAHAAYEYADAMLAERAK